MSDTETPQADHVVFHRAADTGRLSLETGNSQVARRKEQLSFQAGSDLMGVIASLKCDNPRYEAQTIDLMESEAGLSGKITFAVSAIHDGDQRNISVPIIVSAGKYVIPEGTIIQSLLSHATGTSKTAALALRKEVDEFIANRTGAPVVDALFTKTAASTSHPASILSPVINVDKTWLPTDIAKGDLLFVGGAKYRVTSGDHGKLSADSDGAFWTLTLVSEMVDSKEPVKHIL